MAGPITVEKAIQQTADAISVAADAIKSLAERCGANERRLTKLELKEQPYAHFGCEVLKPGAEIELVGGIKGIVVAVMIEPGPSISYKARWASGNNISTEWVSSFAIAGMRQSDKIKIGFGANDG